MIDRAPNSTSICRAISRAPASSDGHNSGKVMRKNTPQRLSPRVRADSSRDGSRLRRVAATGKNTRGYLDRVITRIAPPRPSNWALSDTQVKLLTNAGTANGRHRITPQMRRPGRLLRSSSQARDRPITAQATVTPIISAKVLRSNPNTYGRHSRCTASAQPACQALRPTYTNGNRLRPTNSKTGSSSQIEGRLRRGLKPPRKAGGGSDGFISSGQPHVPAPGLLRHCPGRRE